MGYRSFKEAGELITSIQVVDGSSPHDVCHISGLSLNQVESKLRRWLAQDDRCECAFPDSKVCNNLTPSLCMAT